MCEPSFDYVDTLTSETYLRRRFVHEAIPLHDGLFGIARQLTSNVVDAEDLVQRTMVKAYSRFSSYRSDTHPYDRSWNNSAASHGGHAPPTH